VASKPQLDEIRIFGSPRTESPEIRTVEAAAKAAEGSADSKILVPETLENPHPVARATLQRLKSQKPNEYGCLVCAGSDIFSVSVSPTQLDRALRILNAIVRASEERGFLVQKGETSGYLQVDTERINFSLYEKIDRIPHQQTPAEAVRAAKERKSSPTLSEYRPWWQPQWDYRPSGRLILELVQRTITLVCAEFFATANGSALRTCLTISSRQLWFIPQPRRSAGRRTTEGTGSGERESNAESNISSKSRGTRNGGRSSPTKSRP
jgi:hypothetical protein